MSRNKLDIRYKYIIVSQYGDVEFYQKETEKVKHYMSFGGFYTKTRLFKEEKTLYYTVKVDLSYSQSKQVEYNFKKLHNKNFDYIKCISNYGYF